MKNEGCQRGSLQTSGDSHGGEPKSEDIIELKPKTVDGQTVWAAPDERPSLDEVTSTLIRNQGNPAASVRTKVVVDPHGAIGLVGLPGLPFITEFIFDDDGRTTAASYQASDKLRRLIRAAEGRGLEHKGIVHSHPGSMDTPSQQDLVAFADSLDRNPHP